jgi:hypothetical protein
VVTKLLQIGKQLEHHAAIERTMLLEIVLLEDGLDSSGHCIRTISSAFSARSSRRVYGVKIPMVSGGFLSPARVLDHVKRLLDAQ